MSTSGADVKKLNSIERITLTAHLLAALSTALIAVATALKLSREGRLHEAPLKMPEEQSATQKARTDSPKNYFDI